MTPSFTTAIATSGNRTLDARRDAHSPNEWHRWQLRRGDSTADAGEFGKDHFCRTERAARVEAVLLVADGAISAGKIAQFAMLADAKEAREIVDQLNVAYDNSESSFRIERVATGFQMLTRPEFAMWLDKVHNRQSALKLSPSAMETLTIVAYRQPITRADIEAIRGVQSSEMLKQLMERGIVRIGGEDDSLGRPYLYVTTRLFLESYGLRSLDELPKADELRRKPEAAVPAAEADDLGEQDEEHDEEQVESELDVDSAELEGESADETPDETDLEPVSDAEESPAA